MANEIQLNVDIGNLAPAPSGETRQQYAEELAKRLLVYLPSTNATFKIGGSAPTSDEGPWFKEVTDSKSGNSSYELWVWSTSAAAYIPLHLNQIQLRYFYGTAAPDQTVYDIWVKVGSDGEPLGVLTYNSTAAAWEPVSYTPSEIDDFFEPTVAGKKQIDWGNVINVPASTEFNPRSASGALVPADANYDWEQVYHIDCGQMVIYDSISSLWKTLSGGIGDIKIVSGSVIGSTSDFLAGNFGTILGKNPGWQHDTSSEGRAIVGANPAEDWDGTTSNKKDPGSVHGADSHIMDKSQLPVAAIDVPIRRSNAINGGGPAGNGYMTGDVATGTNETLQTDNAGTGQPTSRVQKSIAYYVIRKTI